MSRKIGNQGEKLAIMFLVKNGYEIIEKNYSTRQGEIDIICKKDEVIIFVEVKTRNNLSSGLPEEYLTRRKIEFLIQAIAQYCFEKNVTNNIQIDLITVSRGKLIHWENIT